MQLVILQSFLMVVFGGCCLLGASGAQATSPDTAFRGFGVLLRPSLELPSGQCADVYCYVDGGEGSLLVNASLFPTTAVSGDGGFIGEPIATASARADLGWRPTAAVSLAGGSVFVFGRGDEGHDSGTVAAVFDLAVQFSGGKSPKISVHRRNLSLRFFGENACTGNLGEVVLALELSSSRGEEGSVGAPWALVVDSVGQVSKICSLTGAIVPQCLGDEIPNALRFGVKDSSVWSDPRGGTVYALAGENRIVLLYDRDLDSRFQPQDAFVYDALEWKRLGRRPGPTVSLVAAMGR